MREIKFRAYIVDGIHGDRMAKVHSIHLNTKKIIVTSRYKGNESIDPDCYSLMQFTGLKDKNGVDIYEGDFVSGHDLPIGSTPAEVIFSDDFGGWCLDGKHCGGYLLNTRHRPNYTTYEVCGNIFEGKL